MTPPWMEVLPSAMAAPRYPARACSSARKGAAAAAVAVGDGRRSMRGKRLGGRLADHERKKGVPWTEEEHRLFLHGLEKYGKGDWRSILQNFVATRTPAQVASHVQKYFIRLNCSAKDKRRSSIHDITPANLPDDQSPQLSNTIANPNPAAPSTLSKPFSYNIDSDPTNKAIAGASGFNQDHFRLSSDGLKIKPPGHNVCNLNALYRMHLTRLHLHG